MNSLKKSFWAVFLAIWGLGATGCGLDGLQSTIQGDGPVAAMQVRAFMVTFWVALLLFVSVGGMFLACLIKYRAHGEITADTPLPDQGHGNPLFEIGVIFVSICLVGIMAVPAVQGIFFAGNLPLDQKTPLTIKVYAYQWWWKFEYPQGFVTANEIAIPVGKPVKFELNAPDVIHSFWIPRLGGKMDLIPGQNNWMWLQSDKEGIFYGQCAEFCGESHAFMRFRCRAMSDGDFNKWVEQQKAPAVAPNPPKPALLKNQCLTCHAIRGVTPATVIGPVPAPDLTHVGGRASLAGGIFDNLVPDAQGHIDEEKTSQQTYENIFFWLMSPGWHKPGNQMWKVGYEAMKIQITQDDAAVLADYLSRLK